MIRAGLVSITFRQLVPAAVIDVARRAGLQGIEWGGDVHVPHGDAAAARTVRRLTDAAGLRVAAYGSYYRLGASEADGLSFPSVLATARDLGAPVIRVWAGTRGSDATDEAGRHRVAADARRCADLAAAAGIRVACEAHGGTLTDSTASAVRFYAEADHANLYAYWQPAVGLSTAECLGGLRQLLPRVLNVHVFHWVPGSYVRLPLREGLTPWRQYLNVLRTTGRDHDALLEFTRDDAPAALIEDAAALNAWVAP